MSDADVDERGTLSMELLLNLAPRSPMLAYFPETYRDWVGGRRAHYLSTNSGSETIAFQGWRRFKEAFAPELVAQAVAETSNAIGRKVESCVDPFAGAGTAPLTCQFLGVHATAIEVNPFLADLTEAKLATYDVDALVTALPKVLRPGSVSAGDLFPGAPPTFVEPGQKQRFVFYRSIAERLAVLRSNISDVQDTNARRLFRVLLASAAIEVSNVTVSGKGRRYRRGWMTNCPSPQDLDGRLAVAVNTAVYDIERYKHRPCLKYSLLRGDARQKLLDCSEVDVAVFSPPYPNSFDYTDVYNVELWTVGYLTSSEDDRRLREATLRSHVQIQRQFSGNTPRSLRLADTLEALSAARDRLWNRYIPDMVAAYFGDMTLVLEHLRARLRNGGRVYMVVGDSRYAGVDVPVASILLEIAPACGFRKVRIEPFRSMRASPQQGGRLELEESLIVLSTD